MALRNLALKEVFKSMRLNCPEQVRHHACIDAAHAFGGWLAILTAWCDHHGLSSHSDQNFDQPLLSTSCPSRPG